MSTCGICGSERILPLFTAVDVNFRTTDSVFTVERCADCGVAQTSPRPSEESFAQFYPPVYYPTAAMTPAWYERKISRYQRDKLALVRRYRLSGRLLDVGCGVGYFVREASGAGFDAEGIEFSAEAVAFGRNHWGLRIKEGDVLRAGLPDGSFDVVTLWQVLEHLPAPAATLDVIRALLRPGGLMVVAVPNFASLQARVFRERWYHLDVPRHLYHFDPPSLRMMLAKHGFLVRGEHHHSREHNWAGIMGSMVPLSGSGASVPGKVMRRLVGRPVSRFAAGLEAAVKAGGTVALIAETPK